MIPMPLYLFLFFELIIVTYLDIRYRKIPNQYIILNLILYFFFISIFKENYNFTFGHYIYSIMFIVLGFIFFLHPQKIMAGGDSKLLASIFLLVPTSYHDLFLLNILWVTILVTGFCIILNILENLRNIIEHIRRKNYSKIYAFGMKIPFTPVILLSWGWLGIEIYGQS